MSSVATPDSFPEKAYELFNPLAEAVVFQLKIRLPAIGCLPVGKTIGGYGEIGPSWTVWTR